MKRFKSEVEDEYKQYITYIYEENNFDEENPENDEYYVRLHTYIGNCLILTVKLASVDQVEQSALGRNMGDTILRQDCINSLLLSVESEINNHLGKMVPMEEDDE